MKLLPQLLAFTIPVVVMVTLAIYNDFNGLVQIKMGLDGAEVTIDGRQYKSEAPPSLE